MKSQYPGISLNQVLSLGWHFGEILLFIVMLVHYKSALTVQLSVRQG